MAIPLSARLREGTKDAHFMAEHAPFIRKFFRCELTNEEYRLFLLQLFHLYSVMEDCQERHRQDRVFGNIWFPVLHRRQALVEDLNFYFGDANWAMIPPQPATQTYLHHLEALSDHWVQGLVAHHYTRYLGDLSGGQTLKRLVAKTFQLSSSEGLAFYEFPLIPDHQQFKGEYRARLDAMPLDEPTCEKIVEEANRAFTLNREIFDSLLDPSLEFADRNAKARIPNKGIKFQ